MSNYVTERVRGKGIGFERKRRITGYLTSNLDTWNNAKRNEEKDRVKHSTQDSIKEEFGVA